MGKLSLLTSKNGHHHHCCYIHVWNDE